MGTAYDEGSEGRVTFVVFVVLRVVHLNEKITMEAIIIACFCFVFSMKGQRGDFETRLEFELSVINGKKFTRT